MMRVAVCAEYGLEADLGPTRRGAEPTVQPDHPTRVAGGQRESLLGARDNSDVPLLAIWALRLYIRIHSGASERAWLSDKMELSGFEPLTSWTRASRPLRDLDPLVTGPAG